MKHLTFARFLLVTLCLALALPGALPARAEKASRPALKVEPISKKNPKYASIVIDAATGAILSQDSADAVRHPASLTKMMTLLMVFDTIRAGRLRQDQMVPVSSAASAMPATKLGLRAGEKIRLSDAMASLATLSANDMSVVLAEAVAGSEAEFARRMTARARQIGMTKTVYRNASGLPDSQQVSTARDQAKLARYMLANYPNESRLFSKSSFTYRGRTYRNHNRLMETYSGMDCCKTGFINASGFNLVASAKRNGRRLIGVVFGGRTTVTRNVHMASLLDAGFSKAGDFRMASATSDARSAALQAARREVLTPSNPDREVPTSPIVSVTTLSPPAPSMPIPAAPKTERIPLDPAPAAPERVNPFAARAPAPSAPQTLGTLRMAELTPRAARPSGGVPNWSIQIGAYQSRLAGDQAIAKAKSMLPARLQKPQSAVLPLRTADASWMFRARLMGFTEAEAAEACNYFQDCLTISPQSY